MEHPRTPINGVSQDLSGQNELTRRLQQRLHIIEGNNNVTREPPSRERTSLGPPSTVSPRHGVPNGASQGTVFVARAQPRQPATYVRGGYGFPPPTSGQSSPAYPWPLAYSGPPNTASNGFQAARTSDPLSRSAPGSAQLPARMSTGSTGQRQALVARITATERNLDEACEARKVAYTRHIEECNGILGRGSRLQDESERLLAEVRELGIAKGELSEEMVQAQAQKVRMEHLHEEYQERYAQERKQLIAAKEELLAENASLWSKDRVHEEKEEKLLAERTELAEQFHRARDATEEERNRYRGEAETLRREKNDLQAQKRELQADNSRLEALVAQMADELKALQSVSGASCSGCRLRATLTKQSSSIEELSSAIAGVDQLLEQARRELRQQELREKRAAIEELHHAMALKLDEDALFTAIERAQKAGVAQEDIDKAQGQLAELLSLTPEEKARRVAAQVEKARKEEAFTFAKRDRAAELQKLLDDLGEGVAWEKWHDSQGRTLLRVAQQLRSENAIKVLENGVEQKHPGTVKHADVHPHHTRRASREAYGHHRPSLGSSQDDSFVELDGVTRTTSREMMSRQASGQGMERRLSDMGMQEAPTLASQTSGSIPPSPMETQLFLPDDLAVVASGDGGAVGSTATPQPPSPNTGQLVPPPTASWKSWYEDDQPPSVAQSVLQPVVESSGPGRPTTEEEEKLKTEAFQACARGNADRLLEILDLVPLELWEKWQNKAGKDLEQLCHERGEKCEGCLRVIFKASGRERQVEREYYEEGENVWVHVKGEVQARQATVMEDTPLEEDMVLIKFWAGYDEPEYVDRGIVSKMYGV